MKMKMKKTIIIAMMMMGQVQLARAATDARNSTNNDIVAVKSTDVRDGNTIDSAIFSTKIESTKEVLDGIFYYTLLLQGQILVLFFIAVIQHFLIFRIRR